MSYSADPQAAKASRELLAKATNMHPNDLRATLDAAHAHALLAIADGIGRLATVVEEQHAADQAAEADILAAEQGDYFEGIEEGYKAAERNDARPTRSEFTEEFRRTYNARHGIDRLLDIAGNVAERMGVVRPDDPAPTEQDAAHDPWAPGTEVPRHLHDEAPHYTILIDRRGGICRYESSGMWRSWRGHEWARLCHGSRDHGPVCPGPFRVATSEELAAAGIEVAK